MAGRNAECEKELQMEMGGERLEEIEGWSVNVEEEKRGVLQGPLHR